MQNIFRSMKIIHESANEKVSWIVIPIYIVKKTIYKCNLYLNQNLHFHEMVHIYRIDIEMKSESTR